MFASIRHIAVMTENWDREAKFYQTIFGMKKITNGMTDETGEYNKNRGHLSDGVIGLALLQRQPGFRSGLDHFGFAVEDVQVVRDRIKQFYPDVNIHQSQSHVPFAGLRGHDPDGNQWDLSQKGMDNVREGYVEFGWEQPRWINHICIRSSRPAYLAEFYQKVFDLKPVEGMSGDNSYYLTDGKVGLAIRPWDMVQYRGHMPGLDHFGFKVDNLEQTKKDLDALAAGAPASAPRKIAIGRDGETRQKNLEGCKLCKQSLSDPDGVLLDLTDWKIVTGQPLVVSGKQFAMPERRVGSMEFANINALSETGLGARDETIQKNSKQILAIIRAVFRAMALAKAHSEETMRMLVSWVKVDEEVAAKSYDLGKRSWSESGVVSDRAVKVVVDQSILELKAKDTVPLDKVRNWSFAEQARRELGDTGMAR